MFQVIHSIPSRSYKDESAKRIVGHFSRWIDPTKTMTQVIKELESGKEVYFSNIATAKKI